MTRRRRRDAGEKKAADVDGFLMASQELFAYHCLGEANWLSAEFVSPADLAAKTQAAATSPRRTRSKTFIACHGNHRCPNFHHPLFIICLA